LLYLSATYSYLKVISSRLNNKKNTTSNLIIKTHYTITAKNKKKQRKMNVPTLSFRIYSFLILSSITIIHHHHQHNCKGLVSANHHNAIITSRLFIPRHDVIPNTQVERMKLMSSLPLSVTLSIRGGANNYYPENDEEYDSAYDDEYDNEYDDDRHESRRPPPRPSSQRPRYPPQKQQPRYNPQRQRNQRPQYPPPKSSRQQQYRGRKSKKPSTTKAILDTTADLTKKSIDLAKTTTLTTLKTSGKAAYYLTAPKHVERSEIIGVWRIDQSVGNPPEVCAANIELTPNGETITKYNNEESRTGYLFQSKSWPRSCSIEFEGEAFQGVNDVRPVRYYYKGYFRRKIADKSVIKIVGKIYEVKKRFWKGKDAPGVAGVEVGSFVARKRIDASTYRNQIQHDQDDEYDEYSDDYYDDEDVDDEYQGEYDEDYDNQ